MNALSVGIPGVGVVRPGTHFCALYSGPAERDRLLYPFLEEGLRQGDKCLCRIDDDVVTIEVRAIAGLTIPLGGPTYTPDGAADLVQDGATDTNAAHLATFPYLGPRCRLPDGSRHHEDVVNPEEVAATEVENRFAGQGAVLLETGDDVGAVVVTMPAEMDGMEVDIRPAHVQEATPRARPPAPVPLSACGCGDPPGRGRSAALARVP